MLEVSSAYKNAIKAASRETKCVVKLDFNNEWDFPFATVTASGTNTDQLCDGRWQASDLYYDSFEDFPEVLKMPSVGWIGTSTSDSSGTLDTPEVIEIEYTEALSTPNFWVVGSDANYPVDFTIEIDEGAGYALLVTVTANTSSFYSYRVARRTVSKFKLTITKISAINTNATLFECGGIGSLVFEDEDISALELLEELNADDTNPFGSISSNECAISIKNEQQRFIPVNRNSPFYGMFKPRMRFQPYMGVNRKCADLSLSLGADDFTIEGWVSSTQDELVTNGVAKIVGMLGQYHSATVGAWTPLINNQITNRQSRFAFQFYNDSKTYVIMSEVTINDGNWHHWAICRKFDTIKLFVDGDEQAIEIYINGTLQVGVTTIAPNFIFGVNTTVNIGNHGTLVNSNYVSFIGNLDEIRVVKGIALYWADFTPSTEAFTLNANTVLLLHFEGDDLSTAFVDDTAISGAGPLTYFVADTEQVVTVVGNTILSNAQVKFNPYSGYFDGSGDYLTLPHSADWAFGSANFTVDVWVYPTNISPSSNFKGICCQRQDISTDKSFVFSLRDDKLYFSYSITGGATTVNATTVNSLTNNAWNHIAIERVGNTMYLYINGVKDSNTINCSTNVIFDSSADLTIGCNAGSTEYFKGYMTELRVSKGIARYNGSSFTPKAVPYTIDAYTVLLMHFNIYQGPRLLQVTGNTVISTGSAQFGSSSLLNDGGNSCLTIFASNGKYMTDVIEYFEMVPCGTFWTEDWNVNTNDMFFNLVGYDRLTSIREQLLPQIKLLENSNIETLLTTIYQKLGLTVADYVTDVTAAQSYYYGYLPNSKLTEALQYIARAGNLAIYVDKKNRVVARSHNKTQFQPITWSDDDMVIDANCPFTFQNVYSKVLNTVYTPVLSTIQTILEIKDLSLANGSAVLERIAFSNAPVLWVSGVKILSTTNVSISSVSYGLNDITLTLSNAGTAETISIEVRGVVVNFATQPVMYQDTEATALFTKSLTVDNKLIQDYGVAESMSNEILGYVTNTTRQLSANVRGDPALELLDAIRVSSESDNIRAIGTILRSKLSWDGALVGEVNFYNKGLYLIYMSMDSEIKDDMGHSLTYSGAISISNEQSVEGGSSAKITDVCQVYILGDDFDVGTADYRFDIWMYPHTSLNHPQALFKMGTFFWHIYDDNLMAYTGTSGVIQKGGTPIVLNQWQHLVWEKIGTTLTVYKDDIIMFTINDMNDYVAGNWIKIGDGGHILAYIDEVKFEVF